MTIHKRHKMADHIELTLKTREVAENCKQSKQVVLIDGYKQLYVCFFIRKMILFQPYYYAIKGKRKDGFTYVLYVNGGHPPWSLLDYMSHCCGIVCSSLNPWYLARFALRKLNLAWFNALPRCQCYKTFFLRR